MNEATRRAMIWAPRLLTMAFAAFLAVFALDVFTEPMGILERAGALAMHMIPSGLLLLALAVAWRREWLGAVIFPLLAAWHFMQGSSHMHWSAYLVIEGPLLLLAVLFLLSWRLRTGPRPDARPSMS